mgnify:CR=1 FL=1
MVKSVKPKPNRCRFLYVKVHEDSRCSRTLLINVAIGSAHNECERILCKDWVWLKMCGKRSRMWPKQEHGIKVWYFDSWTWCKKSCDIWRWSLVPPRLVSHCSACEWSHMEAIVHMANSWMGSMCVVSLFGEEYGFIVRCNICSIMCEAWASTFSPCYDTLALQKTLIHKGIYWYIMKELCCIPSSKSVFHILHPITTQIFLYVSFQPFCLLPMQF